MFYPNKPFLEGLFIFALFLLPVTKAAANDLPQQVNQLQTQLMAANEKIATLTSDQQKTARTVSVLQTSLNNNGVFKPKQLDASNAGIQRTANGHGR